MVPPGFDYFQGHHFCRQQTLTDRTPPSNKLVVLNLLARLADPALGVAELERSLAADASLSYKLLRYVNSAAFARRREVESLRDAAILAGFDAVRNWAALLLLGSIDARKPRELIKLAMIRARMCQRLASPALQGQAFITGLFSVLDALMDVPMAVLLDNLALSAPIRFALLAREGELGALLQQVLWYEGSVADATCLRTRRQSVYRRHELNIGFGMERENLVPDAKGNDKW